MLSNGDFLGLAAVLVVGATVWLYWLRVRAVDVPKIPVGNLTGVLLGSSLAVAAYFYSAGVVGSISATAAIVAAGFFIMMISMSGLPDLPTTARVGRQCPDFTALDSDGRRFTLSSLRGRDVLLIFYRGWWCTYCRAELKRFESLRDRFEALGVELVAISADTVAESAKFKRRRGFSFTILSDERLEVIDLYGIRHNDALTITRGFIRPISIPLKVYIDAEGVVRWLQQSRDYRVRAKPQEVLEAIRREKGTAAESETRPDQAATSTAR